MILPIFACLIGCGEQTSVTVTAKAEPEARSAIRFIMAPGDPKVRPVNSDYIALSKAVGRALAADGFDEAKVSTDGQVVVLIDWSVSEPKLVLRHMGGDSGSPQVKGAAPGGKGGMPAGGTNNYGSFGFGSEGSDRGEYEYTRTVTLKAVDAVAYKADPKAAKALWTVDMVSVGDTDQVAKFAAPVMAVAIPYLAQTTPKVKVRLGATEAPMKYMRGEIAGVPTPTASKQ